jgi:hypothetical protein
MRNTSKSRPLQIKESHQDSLFLRYHVFGRFFKGKIVLLILMIGNLVSEAQNDSVLNSRLLKPVVVDCENIAFNCQEVISNYLIDETDSIQAVVDFWKKNCGISEPVRRVELLLAISTGIFTDTAFADYEDRFAQEYYQRQQYSGYDNFQMIYQNQKASFGFVPLRSALDNWSVAVADQLLNRVLLNSPEHLYCLLLSNRLEEYDKSSKSKEFRHTYAFQKRESLSLEVWRNGYSGGFSLGMWVPVLKLSETFSNSPELGLRFSVPVGQDFRLEAMALVRIFVHDEDFQFFAYDSVYTTDGDISCFLGFSLKKEFFISPELALNLNAGLGLAYIDTDIEKPEEDWTYDQNGNTTSRYYGVESFDLMLGGGFRKRIFNTNSIGMDLSYHFAPYQIDKDLVTNFGDQYVSLAFVFMF